MKKSSKVLWIALIVVAMVVVTTLGAMASVQSTAVIFADSVDVDGKTTFDVGFNFKDNNTDVECGKITLTWDSAKMTANSITAGAALEGAEVESKIEAGKAVIAWAGSAIEAETGALFTVNFTNVAIAVGEVAAIDVAVDNFGYVSAFVSYELAEDVTANKVYATNGDAFVWTEAIAATTEPEDFLAAALAVAESGEGANVNVDLQAVMQFDKDCVIGTPGANHVGSVNVTSALDADGKATAGIEVRYDVIVNCYGIFNFNNITYNYYGKDSGHSWSSGACFQFTEGMGTFGHEETEAGKGDYGLIDTSAGPYDPALAGHVKVYSGSYKVVCGNYTNSKVDVETADLYVGGTTYADYIIGGSHNDVNNITLGSSTIVVADNAEGYYFAGGSWYSNYKQEGSVATIKDNAKITYVSASGVGTYTMKDGAKNVLNIQGGGTFKKVGSIGFNSMIGTATVNSEINITGGTFNAIYGGFFCQFDVTNQSDKGAYATSKTNTLYGTTKLTIKDASLSCTVIGGSQMWSAYSVQDTESTVVLDGVTFATKCNFYGGSDMATQSITYKNSSLASTAEGYSTTIKNSHCAHKGTMDITIKNGTTWVDGTVNGGSNMNVSDSEHSANLTLNAYIDAGSSAAYSMLPGGGLYLGTRLNSSNNVHSGNITATIDKPKLAIATGSWCAVAGGSNLGGTNNDHSGDINYSVKNVVASFARAIIGGSYISSKTGVQSGNTTVAVEKVTMTHTSTISLYGGSMLAAAGAKQTGDAHAIINKSGTFYTTVFGGSFYNVDNIGDGQQGSTKLTINGVDQNSDGTFDSYIHCRNTVYGGSYLRQNNNKQSGSSTLELNNLRFMSASQYNFKAMNSAGTTYYDFYGGSSISGYVQGTAPTASGKGDGTAGYFCNTEMVGDSTLIVRSTIFKRVAYTTSSGGTSYYTNRMFGGSYLDGHGVQSGDSKVILDGKTKVTEDGTVTATGGVVKTSGDTYGGSFVVGYYNMYTDKNGTVSKASTSTPTNNKANHTGASEVIRIGGGASDNDTTHVYTKHSTQGPTFGGSFFYSYLTGDIAQSKDSKITIQGTIYYNTSNDFMVGGSKYSNLPVATEKPAYVPTSMVVLEDGGTYNTRLIGGNLFNKTGNAVVYANSGVILGGKMCTEAYAGHISNGANLKATVHGDSFMEILETANFDQVSTLTAKIGVQQNDARTAMADGYTSTIKFAGSNVPTKYTNLKGIGTFDILDLYRFEGSKADVLAHFTTLGATAPAKVYNAFVDGVAVTLSNKTVENGTVLADFMKGQTVTIGADTYNYDELTKFDAYTTYDNAFDFYTKSFGAEQKVEKVDVINKIIVGEGNDRSAEITLTNSSRDTGIHSHVLGTSLTLSDSIAVNMGVKDTLFTAYSNIRVKAIFNGEAKEYDAPTRDALYSYENIGPHMMNDAVYFMIYATNADGEEVSSGILNQTIKKFCTNKLATSEEVFKKVCMDLLNYGAAAQVYANYQTDTPANTGVDAYKQYATAEMAAVSNKSKIVKIDNATVALQAPNLYLDKNVEIRYTYKPTEEKLEELVAKVVLGNGTEFTLDIVNNADNFIVYEEGGFVLRINQLNPSQMRETVTVSFWKGETQVSHAVTYSIESYVASKLSQTSALKDMIVEMMKYGDAVKAWQDAANA